VGGRTRAHGSVHVAYSPDEVGYPGEIVAISGDEYDGRLAGSVGRVPKARVTVSR
jgi:hypothetical protein